jgi:hypothetical protein
VENLNMSSNIYSWIDGHLAVRQRAYETRGSIELDTGARWPRATGSDVISIAAVFDDAVRLHGSAGLQMRWRATLADLERDALRAPGETYAENRTFWATLEVVAVYLDDIMVSPPSPVVWDTLLHEVGARPRNAGPTEDGPVAHFDGIKTYDDLWNAQRAFLADKRGSDKVPPPTGMMGADMVVPRTTNQDVLQLATYWADQLAKAKQVMGYAGVVAKWKPVMDDVDKLAKPGEASAVYTKNNEFWRGSFDVAVQVALGDESPSTWDMVVDSVKDSVKQLPQTIESGVGKGVELVESGAREIGKVVTETGKGLVSALGAPVLIGAGLLGLFLVTRRGGSSKREDE